MTDEPEEDATSSESTADPPPKPAGRGARWIGVGVILSLIALISWGNRGEASTWILALAGVGIGSCVIGLVRR